MGLRRTGRERVAEAFTATLGAAGYQLEREVPANRVIDAARLRGPWAAADTRALPTHTFDFVAYTPAGAVLWAIEFDGPEHCTPRRVRMDARKNRMCWQAGVSILRLTDEHVRPHDGGVALIDYMFQRHLEWRGWIETEDSQLALDEDDDPSIRFDLERPFPESRRKALHLWSAYGVLASELLPLDVWMEADARRWTAPTLCLDYAGSGDVEVAPLTRCVTVKRELALFTPAPQGFTRTLIHRFERHAPYRFGLPAFDNPWSFSPAPIHLPELVPGLHECVIVWQDIGGVSTRERAHHYADFLAVTDAVKWARKHLPRRAAS